MKIKKLIGIIALSMAFGMLLMMIIQTQFIGLIMIGLLLFVGYICLCDE